MKIEFDIERVTVLVSSGTDKITIKTRTITAFPTMKYDTHLNIDAQHGYGAEWCRIVLGIEPEIIKANGA